MKITIVVLGFTFLGFCSYVESRANNNDIYCYATDGNPYLLFNSETSYEVLHNKEEMNQLPDECEPIFIVMAARHATRYPNLETLRNMTDDLPKIKDFVLKSKETTKLCPEDYQLFEKWEPRVNIKKTGQLSAQGWEDFRQIARRMKKAFPQLFKAEYMTNKYKFYPSPLKRISDSATAFARELWNDSTIKILPGSPDAFTFAYELCTDLLSRPEFQIEYTRFLNSDIVRHTVNTVNERLGLINDNQLTPSEVEILHEICGYETAWDLQSRSAFCSPFTKEALQVFQYLMELDKYYVYSYGNPVSFNIICPLMSTIYKALSGIVKGDGVQPQDPVGMFFFTHWQMMTLLATGLGLFQPDKPPLSADNYELYKEVRNFNSSRYAAFAANVQFILYKCQLNERYRIMIRWQEKPILNIVSRCDKNGLCSWADFNRYFSNRLRKIWPCDLTVCDLGP